MWKAVKMTIRFKTGGVIFQASFFAHLMSDGSGESGPNLSSTPKQLEQIS
jgi:hypothetical protein